jgi:hypothetical protein
MDQRDAAGELGLAAGDQVTLTPSDGPDIGQRVDLQRRSRPPAP